MNLSMRKVLRIAAISTILEGFLFLCLFVNRLFLNPNGLNQPSTLGMIIGFGWFFSIFFWLTGLFIYHKNDLGLTGNLGYISALLGHTGLGIWLFKVDFVLNEAQKNFSFGVGIATILFTWGILFLATSLISNGRFPRLATVLWAGGFLISSAGMGHKWFDFTKAGVLFGLGGLFRAKG